MQGTFDTYWLANARIGVLLPNRFSKRVLLISGTFLFCCLMVCSVPNPVWGQKVVVQSINSFGLEKTKPRAILREMTFAPGDTLELETLEATIKTNQQNLYNTKLFTEVDVEYEHDSSKVWVRVIAKERWYVWPFPFATLEERNFNQWWKDKDLDRLVVGLGLQWSNFTGVDDDFYTYGQLGYSRRFSISYTRPYVFQKARIDGHAGFYYVNNKEIGHSVIQDTLRWTRLPEGGPMQRHYRGILDFTRRFTTRRRLRMGLQYDHFLPADTSLIPMGGTVNMRDSIVEIFDTYLTTGLEPEHYPSFIVEYEDDQRDIKTFPLKGYYFNVLARQSGLPGLGTSTFFRGHISWAHHIPLNRRFNFAYGIRQQFLIGNKVPFFDKQFVGWQYNLRGYENHVIDGSYINLTKAEFKYAIIPRRIVHADWVPFRRFKDFPMGLYLSMYGNAGYVYDGTFSNRESRLKKKMLNGYGIGLNFLFIYDLLIRLEVSRNHFGKTGVFLHATVPIY